MRNGLVTAADEATRFDFNQAVPNTYGPLRDRQLHLLPGRLPSITANVEGAIDPTSNTWVEYVAIGQERSHRADFLGQYSAGPGWPWTNVGGYANHPAGNGHLMSTIVIVIAAYVGGGQATQWQADGYIWNPGPGPFWLRCGPPSTFTFTPNGGGKIVANWLRCYYAVVDDGRADNTRNPEDPSRYTIALDV